MIRDPGNQNRGKLRASPHSFISKVDTPWQDHPDLEEVNRVPFERICFVLDQLKNHSPDNPAASQGVVLLGEAGTGKTHLLMRIAKRLSKSNYVLFVTRPNNEEAVYLHTWSNIVQSLAEVVPARSAERSQLDDLLAHVFSAVLIPEFENGGDQERRWAQRLRKDPLHLFQMLGEGEQREKNFRKIRERTLRYLKQKNPTINETITHALVTYALAAEDSTRRIILTWLAGQGGIDETEAKRLGLPIQWVEVNDQSTHANYLKEREWQAFGAIRTLGFLSTYYQPLILAYDQLEGLRTRESLTRRWSEAVREIINYAPNYLVLTCVFPSLWNRWTADTWVEMSSAQRIGPRKITLEPFTSQHARQLLEAHTAARARELGLPSPIYPFEDADVADVCAKVTTPREFLLEAQERFETWLFQNDPEEAQAKLPKASPAPKAPTAAPPPPPQLSIDTVLSRELERLEKQAHQTLRRRVPDEEDLFGRVQNIVEELSREYTPRFRTAERGRLVMPFNIVVIPPEAPGLCLSILNSSGNSLTARLRNLSEVARQGQAFGSALILRDKRCGAPSGQVGVGILKELKRRGDVYLEADLGELARIHAIYDAIVAIEQQDLKVGARLLTHADLVRHLRGSGYLRSCKLFVKAAELSPLFKELLSGGDVAPAPKG
jgi:hypothetical protein